MSIEMMVNELKHYVFCNLDEYPEEKIREMYINLFGEEEEQNATN